MATEYAVFNEFHDGVGIHDNIKILQGGVLVGLDKTGNWDTVYAPGYWSGVQAEEVEE